MAEWYRCWWSALTREWEGGDVGMPAVRQTNAYRPRRPSLPHPPFAGAGGYRWRSATAAGSFTLRWQHVHG